MHWAAAERKERSLSGLSAREKQPTVAIVWNNKGYLNLGEWVGVFGVGHFWVHKEEVRVFAGHEMKLKLYYGHRAM